MEEDVLFRDNASASRLSRPLADVCGPNVKLELGLQKGQAPAEVHSLWLPARARVHNFYHCGIITLGSDCTFCPSLSPHCCRDYNGKKFLNRDVLLATLPQSFPL